MRGSGDRNDSVGLPGFGRLPMGNHGDCQTPPIPSLSTHPASRAGGSRGQTKGLIAGHDAGQKRRNSRGTHRVGRRNMADLHRARPTSHPRPSRTPLTRAHQRGLVDVVREEAWSAAHCLGCALGKAHQRCDWEANDTEDEGDNDDA